MQIWRFKTKHFTVQMLAEPEYEDVDLSWDEDGSVKAGLESGEFICFCAHARVLYNGDSVANDYLGQCIHRSFDEFRDHIGIKRQPGVGSYFSDMIREVCCKARKRVAEIKADTGKLYIRI